MKYLLIALLFISIDSAAQRTVTDSTLISKWTDTRGASRDTMVITTGTAMTLSDFMAYSHSLSKPDTSAVIMLYCDTARAKEFPQVYNENVRVVMLDAGLCYWARGYIVTQINKLTYYLDDNKKPFDKVVWMAFRTK